MWTRVILVLCHLLLPLGWFGWPFFFLPPPATMKPCGCAPEGRAMISEPLSVPAG